MKDSFHSRFTVGVLTLGLSALFGGCVSMPLRQSTLESQTPSTAAVTDNDPSSVPIPLRTVEPAYPTVMKRLGISGVVNVNCLIDASG